MTARIALLLLVAAWPALAQTSPADLQPKLSSEPLLGPSTDEKERPKLQEPPRAPVTQDSPLSTPPGPAPSR